MAGPRGRSAAEISTGDEPITGIVGYDDRDDRTGVGMAMEGEKPMSG